jgi:hypothetical protein
LIFKCRREPGTRATPLSAATSATRPAVSATVWRILGVKPAVRHAEIMIVYMVDGGWSG